jgi:hypothetical protein
MYRGIRYANEQRCDRSESTPPPLFLCRARCAPPKLNLFLLVGTKAPARVVCPLRSPRNKGTLIVLLRSRSKGCSLCARPDARWPQAHTPTERPPCSTFRPLPVIVADRGSTPRRRQRSDLTQHQVRWSRRRLHCWRICRCRGADISSGALPRSKRHWAGRPHAVMTQRMRQENRRAPIILDRFSRLRRRRQYRCCMMRPFSFPRFYDRDIRKVAVPFDPPVARVLSFRLLRKSGVSFFF